MTPPSPVSLKLARRLLALEASGAEIDAGAGTDGLQGDEVVRVCEKLRTVLTAFAGGTGFRSLLGRSLTLAKAGEPSLANVRVLEDGRLIGFETADVATRTPAGKSAAKTPNAAAPPGARESNAGGEALLAQLLDLLTDFIGEPLTLQLVSAAWPGLAPDGLGSRTEETP